MVKRKSKKVISKKNKSVKKLSSKKRKVYFYSFDGSKQRLVDKRNNRPVEFTPYKKRSMSRKTQKEYDAFLRKTNNKTIYSTQKVRKKYKLFLGIFGDKAKKYAKNKDFHYDPNKKKYIRNTYTPKGHLKKYNKITADKYIRSTLRTLIVMINPHSNKSPLFFREPNIMRAGYYTFNELWKLGNGNNIMRQVDLALDEGYFITTFSMTYRVYDKALKQYIDKPKYYGSYQELRENV
jgi:hypothetical protein